MVVFVSILIIAVVLIINGVLAGRASDYAEAKGHSKRNWFHACFWLGPIMYILVAALPDLVMRSKQDETITLLKQLVEQKSQQNTTQVKNENNGNNDYYLPEL